MKSLNLQRLAAIALGIVSAGCVTSPSTPRIDNIPMYGQPEISRPEVFRKADEDFIKKASAGFKGNREAASRAWAAEGDRFLSELNVDYAMRRYNQSWLLDPNNFQPHWGFGRVMVQTDRFTEGIRHLETAKKLCNDNYQKVALLSNLGVAHSFVGNFQLANRQFQASATLDPTYANAWLRWSQSLYREGSFADAWRKLKQARSLGGDAPDAYLRDLSQKMPEPW